jgi:two-component system chemotaxis response regulator CheB
VRPAVDPLFRSAALAFGDRVVGIVLSGNLDDGTAGLEAIKSNGGFTLVQDPAEAQYPGMVESAIGNGCADEILPVAEIARRLTELVQEKAPAAAGRVKVGARAGETMRGNGNKTEEEARELAIDELELGQLQGDDQPGIVSGLTCPECNGSLWELTASDTLRYRCRVGHAYAVDSLMVKQQEAVEAAFWVALRALEERGALMRRLIRRAEKTGHRAGTERYNEEARTVAERAKTLRDIILSGVLSDGPESLPASVAD